MPRTPDDPAKPTLWRLGFASGVVACISILIFLAYVIQIWIHYRMTGVDPPRTIGVPLHVTRGDASGVFVMTVQEEARSRPGSSRWNAVPTYEQVSHIDLWRFDAGSARPVWRKRLLTERNGSISDVAILGAQGDRLWLFLREPLVLSLSNGEVLADVEAIEARNAPLKGVLPRQMRHYSFFHGYGLALTAADARAWLIDAQTLTAHAWQPKTAARRDDAIGPPYFAPNSITSFQKRGLLLKRDWLGVLTEDEAALLNGKPQVPGERPGAYAAWLEHNRAPPDLSHGGPKRYRLWRAKVEQVSAAPAGWPRSLPDRWGLRPKYSDFVPFEKSPEFLQAGLMSDGRSNLPVFLLNPDSVLVLHRDRIDEQGRLHVTRIAGPDGRTLWDARLPLSIVQAVMPGPGQLVMFGRAFVEPRPAVGDPYHSAHEWLLAIDIESGRVSAFDITAADAERERKSK